MKIALTRRSLLRSLRLNIISITGLSLAFAVAVFISVYVHKQISTDKNQVNYNSIYRLELGTWASLTGGIIPWVAEQFPEVEAYARIGGSFRESNLEYENKYHTIEQLMYMDGDPFSVFNFNFIFGDASSALKEPNAIILTESVSKRIFKDENPIGKIVNYNRDFPLLVTGVIEDPGDIHLNFEIIINFVQLKHIAFNGNDSFMSEIKGSQNYMGYYLLNSHNTDDLVKKIKNGLVEMNLYSADNPPSYSLRPFSKIYFADDVKPEMGVVHGNRQIVIAMIFVAVFVLLIATINYINVTTAHGISRSRETGLKKLFGSDRLTLFAQFITESAILCLVSMIVAIILIFILYQWFQSTLSLNLPPLTMLAPILYIIPLLIIVLVAVAGGLYPAFYLSSVKPASLMVTSFKSGGKGIFIRRSLMATQFIISIFLTIQSLTIFKQYLFMNRTDPGIDIEQIIQFELPDYLADRSDAIREALTEHPNIEAVSYSGQPLGSVRNTNTFRSPINDARIPFKLQRIDPEHLNVLGLELRSGKFFVRDMEGDRNMSVVINEMGARAMGFDPPESITGFVWNVYANENYTIIGVLKDYHFNSLEIPIQPSLLIWTDGNMKASLKFTSDDISSIVKHIENTWKSFEPDKPFNYSFLDETFSKNYNGEKKLVSLLSIFTILSILIACFGVYGISAFMARRMSKNISLRKVMGADTISVMEHFSKEFLWLTIVSGIISIPLGYIYINNWLDRFPYQTSISAWIFIVAFLVNLVIVILTITYHAYKTARLNPADVLRYE